MRQLGYVLLILSLLGATATAQGAEYVDLEAWFDSLSEPLIDQETSGVIEEIDLARRTILVSGYIYQLGPSTWDEPVEVRMYQRDFGALELLRTGMKVKVTYGEANDLRVGWEVEQLSNSHAIDDPE